MFPFSYNTNTYNSCTNVDKGYSWCSPKNISNGQYLKCDPTQSLSTNNCSGSYLLNCDSSTSLSIYQAKFTTCYVAKITSVSSTELAYDTLLRINGSEFSSKQCENEIYIGGVLCALQSSSTTLLECILGTNSGLSPGIKYTLEVLVKNSGYAIQLDNFLFSYVPVIDKMSPSSGKNPHKFY